MSQSSAPETLSPRPSSSRRSHPPREPGPAIFSKGDEVDPWKLLEKARAHRLQVLNTMATMCLELSTQCELCKPYMERDDLGDIACTRCPLGPQRCKEYGDTHIEIRAPIGKVIDLLHRHATEDKGRKIVEDFDKQRMVSE